MSTLDSHRIDTELLQLFRDHIERLFAPINRDGIETFKPELDASFSFLLWLTCIWRQVPTPGQAMMGLRYSDRASRFSQHPSSTVPQRLMLGACWVLVPWVHERLRRHGLSQGWPFEPPESWEARLWALLEKARAIWK